MTGDYCLLMCSGAVNGFRFCFKAKARGIEAEMSGSREAGAGQSGSFASKRGEGMARIAAESPVRAACGTHAPERRVNWIAEGGK